MQTNKSRILIECSLLVALSTALSFCPLVQMPYGGTVTLCATMPLLIAAFRNGVRWGVLTGFVHGLIQMIMGIKNVLICTTVLAQIACILLDYLVAFAVLGLAALFLKPLGGGKMGMAVGCAVAGLLRFGCSFLSGILIWRGYAPPELPVWLYSLLYNGSYLLPEMLLSGMTAIAVMDILPSRSRPVSA